MLDIKKISKTVFSALLIMLAFTASASASEIDLKIPSLDVEYNIF